MLVESGYSVIAYDYGYRYGSFAGSLIFFIISHQIIVIIVTSLMKGVTWEVYNTINGEHEDIKKKMAQEES